MFSGSFDNEYLSECCFLFGLWGFAKMSCLTFKDEAQTAVFKDPVRTAL